MVEVRDEFAYIRTWLGIPPRRTPRSVLADPADDGLAVTLRSVVEEKPRGCCR
jgi:hypothetical protein